MFPTNFPLIITMPSSAEQLHRGGMSSLTSHSDAGGDRARPASKRQCRGACTLLIDSQMIDLIRSKSGEFQIVAKIGLAPGRRRNLAILTTPKKRRRLPSPSNLRRANPVSQVSSPRAGCSDGRNEQV